MKLHALSPSLRGFLTFGALFSAAGSMACGSESFGDCSQSRTCQAGGTAGDGGTAGGGGTIASGGTSGASGGGGGTGAGAAGSDDAGTDASDGSSSDASVLKPNGETCGAPAECASGHCVDGACCGVARCDDGLACNGVESCATGSCTPGVAVECTPADATHCTSACQEVGDAGYTCVAAAKDGDGDGQGTELCVAAPGRDCNDGNRDVFDGARELCDGIDNDCDAKIDLDDGLGLGGTVREIATYAADSRAGLINDVQIAYSAGSKRYLVVYALGGTAGLARQLWSIVLDEAGGVVVRPQSLYTARNALLHYSLASSPDGFAVAVVDGLATATYYELFRLRPDGGREASSTAVDVSPSLEAGQQVNQLKLLHVSSMGWVAHWFVGGANKRGGWVAAVSDGGSVTRTAARAYYDNLDATSFSAVVGVAGGVSVIYRSGGSGAGVQQTLRSRFFSSFDKLPQASLIIPLYSTMSATSTLFVAAGDAQGKSAWIVTEVLGGAPSNLQFAYDYDTFEGKTGCKRELPNTDPLRIATAIVPRGTAFDVVTTSVDLQAVPQGIHLQRVTAACTTSGPPLSFFTGPAASFTPDYIQTATDGTRLATVWNSEPRGKVYLRMIGRRSCD